MADLADQGAGDRCSSDESRPQLLNRVLIGLGLALIVWAVLYMNVSALGMPPEQRTFAHRRPYNEIKRSVHEAFPGFVLRAGVGGLLIWYAARRNRRGRAS